MRFIDASWRYCWCQQFSQRLAAAQTPAKKYNPPRMADGHPDLQGTYDLATLTPLERRSGMPLVMTKEEAAKQEGFAAHEGAGG